MDAGASLRIDRLLYYLRLARTRGAAQGLISHGHLRINGIRVVKDHATVQVGDTLTVPRRDGVAVGRVLALPDRRLSAKAVPAFWLVL